MILGNLYRAKGQVGRAITLHQSLLQRPDLTRLEQAYVQLCLALDFRHGGFVDRALEAFQEVVRLDPGNRYALVNLQKLHEEQQQWADALRVRREIAKLDSGRRAEDKQILAFLTNEIGTARARNGEADAAGRTFSEALDIDPQTAPAYLNLGDVRERQGNIAGRGRGVGIARPRGPGPRAPGVRTPRARLRGAWRPATVRGDLPAAHRAESAGLARAARAVQASRRSVAPPRSARPCCSRRSR